MKEIFEKIKSKKVSDKNKIIIILTIIFLLILILNFLTPLIADDYSYSYGVNDKRITNIIDIVQKQVNHYFNWGGRTVAHSIAQIFLIFPKVIFSIFNSMMYTLLIYLIYLHSRSERKENPLLLVLIGLGVYFFAPVFGQTCLWLIGSCNYLWTTVIILLFLLPYNKNRKNNDSVLKIIFMFIFGIISGWTSENAGFALIVMTCLFMITSINKNNIMKNKWKFSGLAGSVLGFSFMIIAPGNYVRSAIFKQTEPLISRLISRTIDATNGITEYLLPLIIIALILISVYSYKGKRVNKIVHIFFAGAFFAVYSMVLSPEFPERSWFSVVIFTIIGVSNLLYESQHITSLFKYIINSTIVIAILFFIPNYFYLKHDIQKFNDTWKNRVQYINAQKEVGNSDIKFSCYYTDNKKSPAYGLVDMSNDKDSWPNNKIELYYDIDSVICE